MKSTLRVGTRSSQLAQAQTQLVIRKLKGAIPKLKIELKTFTTEGDQLLDQPLWQIDGKDFWVKELDSALLRGQVDLVVHSLKDLSLTRPSGIQCGAIPIRTDPRDILVLNPSRSTDHWRIGTSSPRRIQLLQRFWKTYMEAEWGPLEIEFLRGNVNTRLSRLAHEKDQPGLDGVCIAAAGLMRLIQDTPEKFSILNRKRLVVLPQHVFPGAPGQGALAVECRASDQKTLSLLRKIHNASLAEGVQFERNVLARVGGGCHSPVGATFHQGVLFEANVDTGAVSQVRPQNQHSVEGPNLKQSLFIGSFSPPDEIANQIQIWDPLRFQQNMGWETEWAKLPRPLCIIVTSPLSAQILQACLGEQLRHEIRNHQVQLAAVGLKTWDFLMEHGLAVGFVALDPGKEALQKTMDSFRPFLTGWTTVIATGKAHNGKGLSESKIKRQAVRSLYLYHSHPAQSRDNPVDLHRYQNFVFSSFSNLIAFEKSSQLKRPALLKLLKGRAWIRDGASLKRLKAILPSVRPWRDEFWTVESAPEA